MAYKIFTILFFLKLIAEHFGPERYILFQEDWVCSDQIEIGDGRTELIHKTCIEYRKKGQP